MQTPKFPNLQYLKYAPSIFTCLALGKKVIIGSYFY